MAQELEDGEFWLPSDFLSDDEPLTDFKIDYLQRNGRNDSPHGLGGCFGFNSDRSSPVESVIGSNETESDEDDVVAGLTRNIAQTTIQDSISFSNYKPNVFIKRVTWVSSLLEPKDAERHGTSMCIIDETTPFHMNNVFAPPPKPTHVSQPVSKPTPTTGICPCQAHPQAYSSYLRMQAIQMMNKGFCGQWKFGHQFQNEKMTGEAGKTQGLSMAVWPTLQQSQLQQQHGSVMRPVFLPVTGGTRERTGTGVFLPRNFGTKSHEIPKRTGYSTVLIPERVVHAINLNINTIDAHCQHSNFDYALKQRSNNVMMMAQSEAMLNKELGLFPDWTY